MSGEREHGRVPEKKSDVPESRATRSDAEATFVGSSTASARVVWWAIVSLGAAVGVGTRWLASWMSGLPWAPWRGASLALDAMADSGGAWVLGGLALVGALVGAWCAHDVVKSMGRVAVSDAEAGFHDTTLDVRVARTDVTDVFADGTAIVLLRHGHLVDRWPSDLWVDDVRAAFEGHGWPWRAGGDPYSTEFRRWDLGDETLPTSADALLRARAGFLAAGKAVHVRELCADLAAIGVVVRDEGKVQYWRPAVQGASAGARGIARRT